jgi:hypothetical protein
VNPNLIFYQQNYSMIETGIGEGEERGLSASITLSSMAVGFPAVLRPHFQCNSASACGRRRLALKNA